MTTTPDGLLIVDKPQGWTSHDVVARSRRLCGTRKVGHAGTLDPMATGVLVLGVGRATRLLTYLVGCGKAYAATVRLGQGTLTDDAEGEVTSAVGAVETGVREALPEAVSRLTGDIRQRPSSVSAIKVKGERAYHRVRAGEDVELPDRPVTVERFDIGDLRTSVVGGVSVVDVDIEVTVSSGTYVRALARDLGHLLGSGGHLIALRRTRVGSFTLEQATPLKVLSEQEGPMPVIPLAKAASAAFDTRHLTDEESWKVSVGQRIPAAVPGRTEPVAAVDAAGQLVALLDESRPTARSLVVFSSE